MILVLQCGYIWVDNTMSLKQRVLKLDIFKKVPQELSQPTNRGGCLSILTALAILFFASIQIYSFMRPDLESVVTQDVPITHKQMRVHLSIIFPDMPCQILSLDLQDQMLSHNVNIGSIEKLRLDSNQNRVDDGEPYQLFRQPNEQKQYLNAKISFQKQYGCHLIGRFKVKEVPGNFHISSHAYKKIYSRLIDEGIITSIDISHQIKHLFFGEADSIQSLSENHPQAILDPLTNKTHRHDITQGNSISRYHLDIVPTLYWNRLWFDDNAYQFTYHHNNFTTKYPSAVYFNYQIGGVKIAIGPTKNYTVSQFLIKLCAIIGGIFSIARFLDNALDTFIHDRRNQYQLVR